MIRDDVTELLAKLDQLSYPGERSNAYPQLAAAIRERDSTITTLRAENERLQAQGVVHHDGPCYYCGKPTDSHAGSPHLWPILLCHDDAPGKPQPHHRWCVDARLRENERLRKTLTKIESAPTLYHFGPDENMEVVRAIAHSALTEKSS